MQYNLSFFPRMSQYSFSIIYSYFLVLLPFLFKLHHNPLNHRCTLKGNKKESAHQVL